MSATRNHHHHHRPVPLSLPSSRLQQQQQLQWPSSPFPLPFSPSSSLSTPSKNKRRHYQSSSSSSSSSYYSSLLLLLLSLRSLYSLLPFLRSSSPSFSLFPFSFLVSLLSFLLLLPFSSPSSLFTGGGGGGSALLRPLVANSLLLTLTLLLRFHSLRFCSASASILSDLSGSLLAHSLSSPKLKITKFKKKKILPGLLSLFLALSLLSRSWDRLGCSPFSASPPDDDGCGRLAPMLLPFLSGFLSFHHHKSSSSSPALRHLGRKRLRALSLALTSLFLLFPALITLLLLDTSASGSGSSAFSALGWPLANTVLFGVILGENYSSDSSSGGGDDRKDFGKEFAVTFFCTLLLEMVYVPKLSLPGFLFCGVLLWFSVRELGSSPSDYMELGSATDDGESLWAMAVKPVRHILSESKSRKIALFLLINTAYMVVEFVAGFMSNSLGLISDACHMLFDCAALAIGLYASYISRLPANHKYNYGRGRFEVLSGYVNAVLLVLVGVLIVLESIERILEPQDISTNSLLTVSVGGFLVNVVGLVFFHEEHHHAHGGGGTCSHSHSHHDHQNEHIGRGKEQCVEHQHAHGNVSTCSHSHSPPHQGHQHEHSGHDKEQSVEHEHHHAHGNGVGGTCSHSHMHSHSHSHHNHDHHKHETADCDKEHSSENGHKCVEVSHGSSNPCTHSSHHHHDHSHIGRREDDNGHHSHGHEHDHHSDGQGHGHLHHEHSNIHGSSEPKHENQKLDISLRGSHNHSHDGHTHTGCHSPEESCSRYGEAPNVIEMPDPEHSLSSHLLRKESQKHRHIDHNMEGIFLHVLADTLGSVGVVISTLLIKYKGWLVADPACSIFISVMIISSVIPLLRNSAEILLQRIPRSHEHDLREALDNLRKVRGVRGIRKLHVWNLTNTDIVGTLHLHVSPEADKASIRDIASELLRAAGIKDLTIQVECMTG